MLSLNILRILQYSLLTTFVICFSPDQSTFDAYGLKLAANDIFLVGSLHAESSFLLRLSPYNYSLTCKIGYNNSDQYIYSVATARKMKTNDTIRYVFIGIYMSTNIPFIGSLTYKGIDGPTYVAVVKPTRKTRFPCTGWNTSNYKIHAFNQFVYDETDASSGIDFFVVVVERTGRFAYAFAKAFIVLYNLDTDTVSIQFGNQTWRDSSFLPHAADINEKGFIVVLGYIGDSSTKYTPCAYLLRQSGSNLTVFDSWTYAPPSNSSWQASFTNWDADTYSSKYDMSVSINDITNKVLFGIQITNTIVIFDINITTTGFILPPRMQSNGRALGMGKSVGWFNQNLAVILVNTYSLNYIWSSSQIFTYDVTLNNTLTVKSIIPNIQQKLAPAFGPILLSIVTSNNGTMMILDSQGNVYILLPSPAGAFTDTSSGLVSSFSPCIAGTFSTGFDVQPCTLCPQGSSTQGLTGQYLCSLCSNTSFCPLGSTFGNIDVSSSLFTSMHQAPAYPLSPQSVRFDNILIFNMFMIRANMTRRCLIISPFFWALIAIGIGAIVAVFMIALKYCATDSFGKRTRHILKRFFKMTDLLGEGELWIGGIVSFAIIILAISGYVFSGEYFVRYPIENVANDAAFACDTKITNAQFNSGLMSLVVSPNEDEKPIFELLDAQPFTLNVYFINTLFDCGDITMSQIKDTTVPLAFLSCDRINGTLFSSVMLPSHGIKIQVGLAGTNTVGAVRLELRGPGLKESDDELETTYTLTDLQFAQAFSYDGRLLTQQPSFNIQLTKIINRTYPLLDDGVKTLSGSWIPYVAVNLNQLFVDENEYKYSTSSSTIISIVVNETPFYVLNSQRPIVDESELIFTNLLFTIVCIEIFGFIFLITKLVTIPIVKYFWKLYHNRNHESGVGEAYALSNGNSLL